MFKNIYKLAQTPNPQDIQKYLHDLQSSNDPKSLYRQLSMQTHPDRGGDEQQFKALNQAWENLNNKTQEKNIPNYDNMYGYGHY